MTRSQQIQRRSSKKRTGTIWELEVCGSCQRLSRLHVEVRSATRSWRTEVRHHKKERSFWLHLSQFHVPAPACVGRGPLQPNHTQAAGSLPLESRGVQRALSPRRSSGGSASSGMPGWPMPLLGLAGLSLTEWWRL